jgi:von Willebrand factor type A domain
MLVRPRRELEVLSISALDLFASALGVFIVIAVLMFPYYLRQPSVDAALDGARAQLAAAGHSLREAEREADRARRRRAQAEAALAEARGRLQRAQAAAAALGEASGQAASATQAANRRPGTPDRLRAALTIADLDLVFVMDATGSMRGEHSDLRASLMGIIRVLHRLAPTLRVGFVAYKDQGEPYITRAFPLTAMSEAGTKQLLRFVMQVQAHGGGDVPEPVDQALEVARRMEWRPEARGRILVIGDAPAHARGWQRALNLATKFQASAATGEHPRTISAIFTGEEGGEAFFEALVGAGSGEFIEHQGRMIESVLVSVLSQPAERDP